MIFLPREGKFCHLPDVPNGIIHLHTIKEERIHLNTFHSHSTVLALFFNFIFLSFCCSGSIRLKDGFQKVWKGVVKAGMETSRETDNAVLFPSSIFIAHLIPSPSCNNGIY